MQRLSLPANEDPLSSVSLSPFLFVLQDSMLQYQSFMPSFQHVSRDAQSDCTPPVDLQRARPARRSSAHSCSRHLLRSGLGVSHGPHPLRPLHENVPSQHPAAIDARTLVPVLEQQPITPKSPRPARGTRLGPSRGLDTAPAAVRLRPRDADESPRLPAASSAGHRRIPERGGDGAGDGADLQRGTAAAVRRAQPGLVEEHPGARPPRFDDRRAGADGVERDCRCETDPATCLGSFPTRRPELASGQSGLMKMLVV